MVGAGRILTTKHSLFPFSSVQFRYFGRLHDVSSEWSVVCCKRNRIHFSFLKKWNLRLIPSVCVTSSLLKINNIMSQEPLVDLFLEGDLCNCKAYSIHTLFSQMCGIHFPHYPYICAWQRFNGKSLFFLVLGRQNNYLYHKSRKIFVLWIIIFALFQMICKVSVF